MSPETLDLITDDYASFLLTQEEALDDECCDDEVVLYRWEADVTGIQGRDRNHPLVEP